MGRKGEIPVAARATFDTNSAFVLGPDDVRRVWTLLEDKAGPVEAVAICADAFEREFNKADDLINYANFPAQRIVGLQIGVWSEDGEKASVTFTEHGSPIRFSASGVENEVSILRQHILNLADAIRPWYSFIARIPRAIAFYIFMCIPVACLALIMMLPAHQNRTPPSLNKAILVVLLVFLAVAVLAVGLVALNAWRMALFPTATFALGAGAERHRTYENIRWTVVVGFFVSLVAAVVFALVWR